MVKNLLIASSALPKAGEEVEFLKKVRDLVEMDSPEPGLVKVLAGLVTDGPGCANYVFTIDGPEEQIEAIGRDLAMALFPSKWCYTEDQIEVGTWKNELYGR